MTWTRFRHAQVGHHHRRLRHPRLSRHRRSGQRGLLGRLPDGSGAAVRLDPVLPSPADREHELRPAAALGLRHLRAAGHRPRTGRPAHPRRARPRARLTADQAAEEKERQQRLAQLIVHSEEPAGSVQRHWLAERITDDCPRCGWHGYFHHYVTTIRGDWSNGVCDDCYADLHPALTVTVRYYSARSPLDGEPVAVMRQRTRSDYEFPDLGQMLTSRLSWQHTTMLIDDRRGNCEWDITGISRQHAEQIAAGLAASHWPPDATRLPWVASAYPEG